MVSILNDTSSLSIDRQTSATTTGDRSTNHIEPSSTMGKLRLGLRTDTGNDSRQGDAATIKVSDEAQLKIRSLNQEQSNSNDAATLLQVADSALEEMTSKLGRMREIAVEVSAENSESDGEALSETNRDNLNTEFQSLTKDIDRIAEETVFEGTRLLDGSGDANRAFQALQSGVENDKVDLVIADMHSSNLGSDMALADVNLKEQSSAQENIAAIDFAIADVTNQRNKVGEQSEQFQSNRSNSAIQNQSHTGSENRIKDAEVAEEVVKYTKQNIITNAATSIQAHGSINPHAALALIG